VKILFRLESVLAQCSWHRIVIVIYLRLILCWPQIKQKLFRVVNIYELSTVDLGNFNSSHLKVITLRQQNKKKHLAFVALTTQLL